MAFLTFKGGVHPYDGKELSKEKPVREYLPGKELVYPLSQHIGAMSLSASVPSYLKREIKYLQDRKLQKWEALFLHLFMLLYQEL